MPKIKIYCTQTCPYCTMAKQYLDDKKIVYTQIDVTSDPKAAQDLVKKTGQMGVPVIEIDDKIIVGFDQDQIDQALAKK